MLSNHVSRCNSIQKEEVDIKLSVHFISQTGNICKKEVARIQLAKNIPNVKKTAQELKVLACLKEI